MTSEGDGVLLPANVDRYANSICIGNSCHGDYANKTIKEITRVSRHHSTRGRESEVAGDPTSHPSGKLGVDSPRFYFRPALGLSQAKALPHTLLPCHEYQYPG